MPKIHHYIYRTTCLVTGKFYVGMHSTNDLNDRYLGSGKVLRYSIKKHGAENHRRQILEHLPSREALKLREAELVNEELLADPLCMNLKRGGEGGFVSFESSSLGGQARWKEHTKKTIPSRSPSQAMSERWARGDFESHQKRRTALAKTPESAAKRKETMAINGHQQGEKNSQYGSCWVSNTTSVLKIKKEQLSEYLEMGYQRGRKMLVSCET